MKSKFCALMMLSVLVSAPAAFARYYEPQTARFLQEDPIGFSGGDTNLYAYVRNNPINRTDSFGLLPMDSPGWDRYSEAMRQAYPNSCLSRCVDEHILGISVAGATGIGAIPIKKPFAWRGAQESTNLMRVLLTMPAGDVPLGCKVPVLRSSYLFGAVGRMNSLLFYASTGYEVGTVGMCTQACARGDILSPYHPRQ
ncbi:MAG TPA: hypothetical protein DD417_20975 [Elusimicrobia bacterium]|nr:hypothetical protein [Elusimicrobiota bacterium]